MLFLQKVCIVFLFCISCGFCFSQDSTSVKHRVAIGVGIASVFDAPISLAAELRGQGSVYGSTFTPYNLNVRYRLSAKWTARCAVDFVFNRYVGPYFSHSERLGMERNVYLTKKTKQSALSHLYCAADVGSFFNGQPGVRRYYRAALLGAEAGYDFYFNKHFFLRTESGLAGGYFSIYREKVKFINASTVQVDSYREGRWLLHSIRFLSVELNWRF